MSQFISRVLSHTTTPSVSSSFFILWVDCWEITHACFLKNKVWICVVSKERSRVSQRPCLTYCILALCDGSNDSGFLINSRTRAHTVAPSLVSCLLQFHRFSQVSKNKLWFLECWETNDSMYKGKKMCIMHWRLSKRQAFLHSVATEWVEIKTVWHREALGLITVLTQSAGFIHACLYLHLVSL